MALALALVVCQLFCSTTGESYQVGMHNVSELVDSNGLVLLLFYSNRCHYSMQLLPIFDAAADQLHSRLGGSGQLALGKVNCDEEPEMENYYDIGKYPTIKIVRFQHVSKNEYRGQRSLEAIMVFAIEEIQDPIQQFVSLKDLYDLSSHKYLVIGHYQDKSSVEYDAYRKAASNLKDHCHFHVNFNASHAQNSLTFRQNMNHTESLSMFTGNMSSQEDLLNWFHETCIPIVRTLTFYNAEEITEEGKPLVILFHHPQDTTSRKDFEKVINTELIDELEYVNFLTADGKLFASPLSHMKKTEADLPFIAIDTFMHMYPFRNYDDLHKPGMLKQFVGSLSTGDLHWNYHFGDFVESASQPEEKEYVDDDILFSLPPISKFKDLRPSKHRYTFARDEL